MKLKQRGKISKIILEIFPLSSTSLSIIDEAQTIHHPNNDRMSKISNLNHLITIIFELNFKIIDNLLQNDTYTLSTFFKEVKNI